MKYKLKNLVDSITVGQIMSRVSYKDGEETGEYGYEVKVLMPSAISGGVVHHENLVSMMLKKEVSETRITREGDVVIKLSSPYECAFVTNKDEGLVVPNFCALIRGLDEERIDGKYLVGFLNSDFAAKKLLAGMHATAAVMVRGKSLEELEIVMPPLNEQTIIGEAYWASCENKQILQLMAEHQQKISDTIIMKVLKGIAANEE